MRLLSGFGFRQQLVLSPHTRNFDNILGSSLYSTKSILSMQLSPTSFDIAESVNAWSVAGNTLASPDLASNLFASSLFPYLAMLYFLSRPETKTPTLANFGFQFLLVFVFATIPAGIIAKTTYHDILANVDVLHGAAESFLTLTNLLIISGFRATRTAAVQGSADSIFGFGKEEVAAVLLLATLSVATLSAPLLGWSAHDEPGNALSIPTWIVHSSSLIEWLAAMRLIWEHAETSGNPRWRGMTWAMVPSHMSGLCACTYHLFYNSPVLLWLVALQGALTVIGNSTMAAAAFRIYSYAARNEQADGEPQIVSSSEPGDDNLASTFPFAATSSSSSSFTSASSSPSSSSPGPVEAPQPFWSALVIKSGLLAFLAKYAALYLPFLFVAGTATEGGAAGVQAQASAIALALVLLPTALNILKWQRRSEETALVDDVLAI